MLELFLGAVGAAIVAEVIWLVQDTRRLVRAIRQDRDGDRRRRL